MSFPPIKMYAPNFSLTAYSAISSMASIFFLFFNKIIIRKKKRSWGEMSTWQ